MSDVLERLKGHGVWQVLVVYLGVSWVALQVVDLLKENMGLPDWVFPFALALLVIGLPIILATALIQGRVAAAAGEGPNAVSPGASTGTPVGARAGEPGAGDSELAPRRLFTWRNAILGGVFAFILLAVVTTGFMFMRSRGIGPVGSLVAKGVLDERSPVVLADFSADDEALSRAATEAFRVDLSQTRIVRVAERATIEGALERMQRDPSEPLTIDVAREAARREGIPAVIGGEITGAGGSYVLTARLVSADDGAVLASHRETAREEGDIIPAIDRLSGKIREKIGESFTSLRADAPLEAVTTTSLDALELYSRAVEVIAHQGDSESGIRLLEEALEIDPEFASAWRKLGVELSNERRERARATQAKTRAYELRDRLTPRERYLAEASYYNDVRQDDVRAIAAYERMLDLDPNDPWAINNLAILYQGLGDEERGLEMFERVLSLEDTTSVTLGNVAFSNIRLGRYEEAAAAAAAGKRLFPEDERFYFALGSVAMNTEDYDGVVAAMEELEAAHPANPWVRSGALYSRAEVAALHGRLGDAEMLEQEAISLRRQLDLPGAGYEWFRFWLTLEVRADTAAARRHLRRMSEEHPLEEIAEPLDRPYFGFAQMHAALGEAEAARGMIDAFRRAVPDAPDARWLDDRASVEGNLALHQARYDAAIEHFSEVRRLEPGCQGCELYAIALAHDHAGRADSAIAWYRRDLETPSTGNPGPRPIIFERLAELYDGQGDLENAALYYARFVDLWKDADAELQPRVEAARARLEEIVRERG